MSADIEYLFNLSVVVAALISLVGLSVGFVSLLDADARGAACGFTAAALAIAYLMTVG